VCALSFCALLSGSAGAAVPAHGTRLRLQFRLVGSASWVIAAGSYVSFGGPLSPCCGTLMNDQTGTRVAFAHPDCSPLRFGGPWLLAECVPPALEPVGVYGVKTGEWRAFGSRPGEEPVAVGADWIELRSVQPCPLYCKFAYAFVNIRTGARRTIAYREGGRLIPDLNSPRLVRRLCSPLRVPRGPGTVTFAGGLEIVSGGRTHEAVRSYFERCGTRLHMLLPLADLGMPDARSAANPQMIVWLESVRQRLDGVLLPSLRPFTVRLPDEIDLGAVGVPFQIALSATRMYVLDGEGRLWSAPLPRAPTRAPGAGAAPLGRI
jgi:hypothetical protein